MFKLMSNEGKLLGTFASIEDARKALQERPSHHSGYIQYTKRAIESYHNDELQTQVEIVTQESEGTHLYRVMLSDVGKAATSIVVPAASYDDAIETVKASMDSLPESMTFDAWRTGNAGVNYV